MSLKLKLLAAFLVLGAVPAVAAPVLTGGDDVVVAGRAHVEEGAFGTYVVIEPRGSATAVAGYVAHDNQSGFPDLYGLDGQRVQIHGVVSMYGMPLIQMTSADQLQVIG